MRILISILGNAIGLLVAVWLLPQFLGPDSISWTGTIVELLLAGAIIGLINGILRPIIRLLSFPLILLTAGVFGLVINVLMLVLADYLLADLAINSIGAYVGTTIILAIVHVIL